MLFSSCFHSIIFNPGCNLQPGTPFWRAQNSETNFELLTMRHGPAECAFLKIPAPKKETCSYKLVRRCSSSNKLYCMVAETTCRALEMDCARKGYGMLAKRGLPWDRNRVTCTVLPQSSCVNHARCKVCSIAPKWLQTYPTRSI